MSVRIGMRASFGLIGLMLIAAPGHAVTPTRIIAASDTLGPELIAFRRDLHMHPELSGEERRTSRQISDRLGSLGLEVHTNIGGYGVVGILLGDLPGKVVAYRADMDAIPIQSISGQPWRSQVPGVSHACGHDVHTSIAIGIASVLAPMAAELRGSVVFIFQPAEETISGARLMLKEGALDIIRPDAIFSLHTSPIPAGLIGIGPNVGLSGGQDFTMILSAEQGYSAEDLAGELLERALSFGTIPGPRDPASWPLMGSISDADSPLRDFVYMVAKVDAAHEAGSRSVNGHFRFPNETIRQRTEKALEALRADFETEGISVSLELSASYLPPTQADAVLAENAFVPVAEVLGQSSPIRLYASIPYFGEDFAFFQEQIPGAMFFLGTSNLKEGITAQNHTPNYDVDESSIVVGTKAMTSVLLDFLGYWPVEFEV